jgi:hypothetical protein
MICPVLELREEKRIFVKIRGEKSRLFPMANSSVKG